MSKRKFLVVTNNFSEKIEAASVLIKWPAGHVIFFEHAGQVGRIVAYYSASSFVSFKSIEES